MTVHSLVPMAAIAITVTLAAGPAAAFEVVDRLRASGAVLHELGSVAGLEGYWVEPASGGGWPLYVAETGHAIAGLLHDASGRLLTVDQVARLDGPREGRQTRHRSRRLPTRDGRRRRRRLCRSGLFLVPRHRGAIRHGGS